MSKLSYRQAHEQFNSIVALLQANGELPTSYERITKAIEKRLSYYAGVEQKMEALLTAEASQPTTAA